MTLRTFLIAAFSLSLFSACEPDEAFLPESEVATETDASEATGMYLELLNAVNELRAQGCRCGNQDMPPVAPVQWNTKIAAAAREHSDDMQRNQYFDHTGTDGSEAGDRLTRNGYPWQTYGENLALGYPSANAVFQGWKDSAGHCKNMMKASFREMGAARAGDYWTQVFARSF